MKAIIVAPAKQVSKETISEFVYFCTINSIECDLSTNLFKTKEYFSGTEEERLSDLQNAINNDKYDIIFCARGGYGTSQIIDKIDLSQLFEKPKKIIGFSDITILLNHLSKNGLESIHGPVAGLFDANNKEVKKSFKETFDIIKTDKYLISVEAHKSNIKGDSEGKVVGGNLTMLTHSLGTPSEIETEDSILVIEEVDEYLYEIDRLFLHLKRSNKLEKIRGLILGYFSHMKDGKIPFGKTLEEIVFNYIPENIPVAFGFPFGHEDLNLPIIIGRRAEFKVNNHISTLKYL